MTTTPTALSFPSAASSTSTGSSSSATAATTVPSLREKDEATRDFVKLVYELGPYVSYKCLFLADIKENKVRSDGYLMKIQHFGYLYFVSQYPVPPPFHVCSNYKKRRPRSRTVLDWVTVSAPALSQLEPELEEAAIKHLRTEGTTLVHIASTENTLHVKFKFDKAADRWLQKRIMRVNNTEFYIAPCREQLLVKQVEEKIHHAEKNVY